MASAEEVRLGRLVVQRGLATEEQVLSALRDRNARPHGPDLGTLLETRGLLTKVTLFELRDAVRAGAGAPVVDRTEQSTDHAISLGGTREILARDQVEEALAAIPRDPEGALAELRRLAVDFKDTESGVRAEREARALELRLRGGA